jgi:hypothetical protein
MCVCVCERDSLFHSLSGFTHMCVIVIVVLVHVFVNERAACLHVIVRAAAAAVDTFGGWVQRILYCEISCMRTREGSEL